MLARGHADMCRQGFANRERGAVAVEFALVLPLLVMLLLGVTTAGVALSHGLGVTNAVREGARFGATAPFTTSGTWSTDVIERTRATQFDDPAEVSKICVNLFKQGTGDLVASSDRCSASTITETPASFTAPADTPNGSCVVRVWAARRFQINIAVVQWDKVMTRQSVAVHERSC